MHVSLQDDLLTELLQKNGGKGEYDLPDHGSHSSAVPLSVLTPVEHINHPQCLYRGEDNQSTQEKGGERKGTNLTLQECASSGTNVCQQEGRFFNIAAGLNSISAQLITCMTTMMC